MPAIRVLTLLLVGFTATCGAAQIQFVGVMANAEQTLFALRETETSTAKWISIGDRVGEFVAVAYDSKTESLTLAKRSEHVVLRLPESRVQMARDEVLVGLEAILNIRGTESVCDLLHPKLRSRFRDADCDSTVFKAVLAPGAQVEIRGIPEEFASALAESLSEVEKLIGVRPTHGLWTLSEGHLSMTFVVKLGERWYLAPSPPHGR